MEATMNAGGSSRPAAAPPNRPLWVRASRAQWTGNSPAAEEPMSPTGRVMEDIGIYIVYMIGLATPVNLPIFRQGIETELITRFPRFCSIQTINDVLVGVTSSALSRYYFRKSGDSNTKKICLRSILTVNTRPMSTRQIYVNKVEYGNRVGCLICPFHIALHDDPLEYVRKAKKIMSRKKSSLEVMLTQWFGEVLVKYFGVKAGSFIIRRFLAHTTIVFSNAIGPAEQITLCGHPVAFMALSLYGSPQALTVHYHNYGSTIKVILAVDEAQFPDCHQLLDDFSESIKLIKDAASLKTSTASMKNFKVR